MAKVAVLRFEYPPARRSHDSVPGADMRPAGCWVLLALAFIGRIAGGRRTSSERMRTRSSCSATTGQPASHTWAVKSHLCGGSQIPQKPSKYRGFLRVVGWLSGGPRWMGDRCLVALVDRGPPIDHVFGQVEGGGPPMQEGKS